MGKEIYNNFSVDKTQMLISNLYEKFIFLC